MPKISNWQIAISLGWTCGKGRWRAPSKHGPTFPKIPRRKLPQFVNNEKTIFLELARQRIRHLYDEARKIACVGLFQEILCGQGRGSRAHAYCEAILDFAKHVREKKYAERKLNEDWAEELKKNKIGVSKKRFVISEDEKAIIDTGLKRFADVSIFSIGKILERVGWFNNLMNLSIVNWEEIPRETSAELMAGKEG